MNAIAQLNLHNMAMIKSAWWAWSGERCHRRSDLELALERWMGIYQVDKRACHTFKSECVTPGVHRKGNAHFLLSSIIADYDHIHLFGSHNTQLAHRELKPLSFLHCFATLILIVHASESLLFIKETKASPELLHLSLLDHGSLVLEKQPCISCTEQENPSIFTNFPSSLLHSSPSKTTCSQLCRRQKSAFDKVYGGLDAVSTQLLSHVLRNQSKEKKPKTCLQKSN